MGSVGGGTIADPRAYLQSRFSLFAKVLAAFFAGGGVLSIMGNWRLGRPLLSPEDLGSFFVVLIFAGAWQFTQRGERSMRLLKGMDVVMTLVAVLIFAVGVPLAPVPAGAGVIMLWACTFFVSVVMVLRAAIVPSSPWLTLAIGGVAALLMAFSAVRIWDLPSPLPNLAMWELAAGHCGFLTLFHGLLSGIISKITFGLQAKVREAMQLGQYTLIEKIGEGGMGEVYRAQHALLRRPTAIKLLPPDKAGEHAIARFEREVQHTSRLTHPNTVAIYDFGRTPDGVFYYAMEFLDGVALDALVAIDGPQPAARVIRIVSQAAEALAEAHSHALIHRDVKPANIILCNRGGVADVVKVLDFGLVKDIAAPADAGLSTAATLTGTPLYMAPESLIDPSSVDARTDIYALGGVAYFLLTGRPVFDANTVVEVCGHHLHTMPTPPSELADGIDEDLDTVVLGCLAKAQGDRPETAGALRDMLQACAAAEGWSRRDAERWWAEHADEIDAERIGRADTELRDTAMVVDFRQRA